MDKGKRNVIGVGINVIDYNAAIDRIFCAATERKPLTASATAVHGLVTGARDPQQCYRLNTFDLVLPDGQPIRWSLNRLHKEQMSERVYGPELMLRICTEAQKRGISIFLFGSSDETLSVLSNKMRKQFPSLTIAGTAPSVFRQVTDEERIALINIIRSSGAGIVFVGLGCPRQEVWTYENTQAIGLPVIAVGAAFTLNAGLLRQAPKWMQDCGLEWLYRLYREPTRLAGRYFTTNPYFVFATTLQKLGCKRMYIRPQTAPEKRMNFG